MSETTRTALLWMCTRVMVFGSLLMGGSVLFIAGGAIESKFFPPLSAWRVDVMRVDGLDLIISGTVLRSRNGCSYQPPPNVFDSDGDGHAVVSYSVTAAQSWEASETPRRWGPWRVIGGAGEVLHFSQRHQCHPLWVVVSTLGTVDARAKP